jgi:tetratricopeptide (TPR) repeat protein
MEDNQEQKREIGGQGQIPGGEDLIPGSSMFLPLAESLRLQGQYDEAIEILKGGLERKPDALPARLLLGRCYLEKGWIPQAKEELERVAREIEECFSVYRILSQVYLQAKDVDKALEALRKTLCFQAAEEGGSRKVTPLEMGLFHGSSRPPFATPSPPPVAPDPPSREPKSKKREPRGPFERIRWRRFTPNRVTWIEPCRSTWKFWLESRRMQRCGKNVKP